MIKAFLYDARGHDREIELSSDTCANLQPDQLLWLDVAGRDDADLITLTELGLIDRRAMRSLSRGNGVAALDNYANHFHCCFITLPVSKPDQEGVPQIQDTTRLDLVVGKNWLLTVGDEGFDLFEAFRARDHAETLIGILSSGTLAASLLDIHLSRYIAALEALENWLDRLDVKLLAGRTAEQELLGDLVDARRYVSRLRHSLAPQRSIFYGLARPDFLLVADTAAGEAFRSLERRFDRVVDAVEHGRELVQGSFELFTTRVSESTNTLIRRLTFISLALGAIGAAAGIFGMNFQTPYTETGVFGFWMVVGTLLAVTIAGFLLSKARRWI